MSQNESESKQAQKYTPSDFSFGDLLGEGSYARVLFAKHKASDRAFAVKIVNKAYIVRQGKQKYITNEKNILLRLSHPNIIKLHATFRDSHSLYFVLELAPGGELFQQIKRLGKCPLKLARFYAAELVNAIGYLHSENVIHRDLKPENILLSGDGHIKLADFGTAKLLNTQQDEETTSESTSASRRFSFVGTADYVSPEMVTSDNPGKGCDFWALGCIIYQLLAGEPPFRGGSEFLTFEKIRQRDFVFPPDFPEEARDLVDQLLAIPVETRLGCRDSGIQELRQHEFFQGIDFDNLQSHSPPSFTLPEQPNLRVSDSLKYEEICSPLLETRVLDETMDRWNHYLRPGETILVQGLVSKRRGLFAKRRHLILTDTPRLFYIDPESGDLKGDIPFSSAVRAEVKDNTTFYVHTPKRSYYLQGITRSANEWVTQIISVLSGLSEPASTTSERRRS